MGLAKPAGRPGAPPEVPENAVVSNEVAAGITLDAVSVVAIEPASLGSRGLPGTIAGLAAGTGGEGPGVGPGEGDTPPPPPNDMTFGFVHCRS